MPKSFFEMMDELKAEAEKDLFQRIYKKILRKEIVCRWGIVEWGFWGTPIRPRFSFEYRFFYWKWHQLRYGFDPRDCWNLDGALVEWLLPRLKYYKQNTMGHPCMGRVENCWEKNNSCDCTEEWYKILDEMIEGFEVDPYEFDAEGDKKREKAFELLGKWAQALWI